jgi:carbon starvation protein
VITTSAAFEKIFSSDVRVGFLSAAKNIDNQIKSSSSNIDINVLQQLSFNLHLNVVIVSILVVILWIVVFDVCKLIFWRKHSEKTI